MKNDMSYLRMSVLDRQKKWLRSFVRYLSQRVIECEIVAVVIAGMLILHTLPYFNVYLTPVVAGFILLLLVSRLFALAFTAMLGITLGLFLLCFLFLVRGDSSSAESIGNLIYFLLCYLSVWYARDIWREQTNHR